ALPPSISRTAIACRCAWDAAEELRLHHVALGPERGEADPEHRVPVTDPGHADAARRVPKSAVAIPQAAVAIPQPAVAVSRRPHDEVAGDGDVAEAIARIAVVVRDAGISEATPAPARISPAAVAPAGISVAETSEAHVLRLGLPGRQQDHGDSQGQGPPQPPRAYEEALHPAPPPRPFGQPGHRNSRGIPPSHHRAIRGPSASGDRAITPLGHARGPGSSTRSVAAQAFFQRPPEPLPHGAAR